MGRRIRWLGVIMVVCLGLVVAQLVNIQLVKAKQLQNSPNNPGVAAARYTNPRGMILAADGTVLAKSVPTPAGTNRTDYPYDYVRQYPQGPLYAGITGYDSALYYGTAGIEEQYDSFLGPHQQPPQTLSQLIFRQSQPTITDNVTLTVEPALQQAAWNALTTLPPGANKDGAVVVMQPSTGNILAMVSNPTFDPNPLVSTSLQAEQSGLLQLHPEGPRGLLPVAADRHRRDVPAWVHHEGRDEHRRLQPQAEPGGLQLPGRAVPEFSDSVVPAVRPVRAVRRDDDPDAPVLL